MRSCGQIRERSNEREKGIYIYMEQSVQYLRFVCSSPVKCTSCILQNGLVGFNQLDTLVLTEGGGGRWRDRFAEELVPIDMPREPFVTLDLRSVIMESCKWIK
jgi:hypothetical protein